MGSRARKYHEEAGEKDLTPFEKVQKWFEIAGMEDYGVGS